MRALLKVSVLLSVVVAWAASASPEAQRRAGSTLAPRFDEVLELSEAREAFVISERATEVEVPAGTGTWAEAEIDTLPAGSVPLELVVVDAETGMREQVRHSTVIAQSAEVNKAWRSPTHVCRGDMVRVEATVAPAAGHVPDRGGAYEATAYISRQAGRVRMLAPLRREADVVLRVIDAAGSPAGGAKVKSVALGGGEPRLSHDGPVEDVLAEELGSVGPGSTVACTSEPVDSNGRMRIRGIPHLLDERFWIAAGVEDHENYTELRLGSLGGHVAEMRLPTEPTWVWPAADGLRGRGCGGRRSVRTHCGRYLPARLEVVVLRRDGVVADDVTVALGFARGTTDENGRVVFERLRPDTYELDVRAPDFVWSKSSVELRDGESRIVEILESPGWMARATLLDSMGRRVPFARVDVSSRAPVEYVRVEAGVQELAFYTDANGDVEFPRMHHAPVRLTFRYGSRTEGATLEEGDPYATVQLPPP